MSKKDLNVNLSYDGDSPEIANAEQAVDLADGSLIQAVDVEMTEPIKNVKTTQEETITPSQQQTDGADVILTSDTSGDLINMTVTITDI